jgi:hypothetical protein
VVDLAKRSWIAAVAETTNFHAGVRAVFGVRQTAVKARITAILRRTIASAYRSRRGTWHRANDGILIRWIRDTCRANGLIGTDIEAMNIVTSLAEGNGWDTQIRAIGSSAGLALNSRGRAAKERGRCPDIVHAFRRDRMARRAFDPGNGVLLDRDKCDTVRSLSTIHYDQVRIFGKNLIEPHGRASGANGLLILIRDKIVIVASQITSVAFRADVQHRVGRRRVGARCITVRQSGISTCDIGHGADSNCRDDVIS